MAAERYTAVVRSDGKVRKRHCPTLGDALSVIEEEGRELEANANASPAGGTLIRRLEPVQIVVGRLELAGPGRLRAGIDVRGDGSKEAFTGRLRRQVIEQRPGESAYDALRRELA